MFMRITMRERYILNWDKDYLLVTKIVLYWPDSFTYPRGYSVNMSSFLQVTGFFC